MQPQWATPFGPRPSIDQINKYAGDLKLNTDDYIVEKALDMITGAFKNILGSRKLRTLGHHIALNGMAHFPPLTLKTSCGMIIGKITGKTSKNAFVTTREEGESQYLFYADDVYGRMVRNMVESIMGAWSMRIPVAGLVSDCEKVELLDTTEVEEGKVRIFNIYDMPYTIAFRAAFGDYNALMVANHRQLPTKIGFDPDTHAAFCVHPGMATPQDPDFGWLTFDVKRMDKNTSRKILELFKVHLYELYDEACQCIVGGAVDTLSTTVHIWHGLLYITDRGNMSGNPITTELNCFAGWLVSLYTLLRHLDKMQDSRFFEWICWNQVQQSFWLALYGDDVVMTWKKADLPHFNEQVVREGFKEFGFDIEVFDKMNMVGRELQIKEDDGIGHWVMPMLKGPIIKMVTWVTTHEKCDPQIVLNLAMRQAAMHEPAFYEKIVEAVKIAIEQLDCRKELLLNASQRSLIEQYIRAILLSDQELSQPVPRERIPGNILEALQQSIPDYFEMPLPVNPISQLYEFAQHHGNVERPIFTVMPGGTDYWQADLSFRGYTTSGCGTSKQSAKNDAARNWLEDYGDCVKSYDTYGRLPKVPTQHDPLYTHHPAAQPPPREVHDSVAIPRNSRIHPELRPIRDERTRVMIDIERDLAQMLERVVDLRTNVTPRAGREVNMLPGTAPEHGPRADLSPPLLQSTTSDDTLLIPRSARGAVPTSMEASGQTDNLYIQACERYNCAGAGRVTVSTATPEGSVIAVLQHSFGPHTTQPMVDLAKLHRLMTGDILIKLQWVGNAAMQGQIAITQTTRAWLLANIGVVPTNVTREMMLRQETMFISCAMPAQESTFCMKRVSGDGQPTSWNLTVDQWFKGDYDQDVTIVWLAGAPIAINSPDASVQGYLNIFSKFASHYDAGPGNNVSPVVVRGYVPGSGAVGPSSNRLEGQALSDVFTHLDDSPISLYTDGIEFHKVAPCKRYLQSIESAHGGLIPAGTTKPELQRFTKVLTEGVLSKDIRLFITLHNMGPTLEATMTNTPSFKALFDGKTKPEDLVTSNKMWNEAGVPLLKTYTNAVKMNVPSDEGTTTTLDLQHVVFFKKTDGTQGGCIMQLMTVANASKLGFGIPRGIQMVVNPFLGTTKVIDPSSFETLPSGYNKAVITSLPVTTVVNTNVGPSMLDEDRITRVFNAVLKDKSNVLDFELYNPSSGITIASLRWDPKVKTLLLYPEAAVANYMVMPSKLNQCIFRNVTESSRTVQLTATNTRLWGNRTTAPVMAFSTIATDFATHASPRAAAVPVVIEALEGAEAAGALEGMEAAELGAARLPSSAIRIPKGSMGFSGPKAWVKPKMEPVKLEDNPLSSMETATQTQPPVPKRIGHVGTQTELPMMDIQTQTRPPAPKRIGNLETQTDNPMSDIQTQTRPEVPKKRTTAGAQTDGMTSADMEMQTWPEVPPRTRTLDTQTVPGLPKRSAGAATQTQTTVFDAGIQTPPEIPNRVRTTGTETMPTEVKNAETQTPPAKGSRGPVPTPRRAPPQDMSTVADPRPPAPESTTRDVGSQTPWHDPAYGDWVRRDASVQHTWVSRQPDGRAQVNNMRNNSARSSTGWGKFAKDAALAFMNQPIDIKMPHNMTPYSAPYAPVYTPTQVTPRGSAVSAPVNAAVAVRGQDQSVRMHDQDVEMYKKEAEHNRQFAADEAEKQAARQSELTRQQYEQSRGLAEQHFGFDQKLSDQGYRQSSKLSDQGYRQSSKLAHQGFIQDKALSQQGFHQNQALSEQGFHQNQALSTQGFHQNQALSKQGYEQDRGLNQQTSDLQLRNQTKLSAQDWHQQKDLSAQGYKQDTGLAHTTANLALRNTLGSTAAGGAVNLALGAADTAEKAYLQHHQASENIRQGIALGNAAQQRMGVTTSAMTIAAQ